MKLNSSAGALLFETFVALMVLSVGITGSLRMFSESLYVGEKNAARAQAQPDLDQWLFEWHGIPGGLVENQAEGKRPYQYKMVSKPLDSMIQKETEKPTGLKPPAQEREYHEVTVEVTDENGKKITEFETVVFTKKT